MGMNSVLVGLIHWEGNLLGHCIVEEGSRLQDHLKMAVQLRGTVGEAGDVTSTAHPAVISPAQCSTEGLPAGVAFGLQLCSL